MLFIELFRYEIVELYNKSAMNKSISIQHFETISVIGKGSYAKVLLVRSRIDNNLYAIKSMKKSLILQKNQSQHIMRQKQILAGINHPFLVKMKLSFQDQKKLYFLLQYCPGGQLFTLLSESKTISQQHAKFYAAQIVLALEALHNGKIVYRDLKPQNIIIDKLGYVKLTDFGLSKILNEDQTTMSICGTPQYLAPEVIKKTGHGMQVDWWCLGCLIHEMITGTPPFKGQNRMELFEQIIYKNPDLSKFSPRLQSLLKRLLTKDPKKRLGHSSAKQIKESLWFEQVNWDGLLARKIKAPYVPKLKSQIDTNHFDRQFTKSKADSGDQSSPADEAADKFKDFQYS